MPAEVIELDEFGALTIATIECDGVRWWVDVVACRDGWELGLRGQSTRYATREAALAGACAYIERVMLGVVRPATDG